MPVAELVAPAAEAVLLLGLSKRLFAAAGAPGAVTLTAGVAEDAPDVKRLEVPVDWFEAALVVGGGGKRPDADVGGPAEAGFGKRPNPEVAAGCDVPRFGKGLVDAAGACPNRLVVAGTAG